MDSSTSPQRLGFLMMNFLVVVVSIYLMVRGKDPTELIKAALYADASVYMTNSGFRALGGMGSFGGVVERVKTFLGGAGPALGTPLVFPPGTSAKPPAPGPGS